MPGLQGSGVDTDAPLLEKDGGDTPGSKPSFHFNRDSIFGTLIVATLLCVVCSVVVAGAAVGLRPLKDANEKIDRQRNVLVAAGVLEPSDVVRADLNEKLDTEAKASMTSQEISDFVAKRVRPRVVDLDSGQSWAVPRGSEKTTGNDLPADLVGLNDNTLEKLTGISTAGDKSAKKLSSDEDRAGLSSREKYAVVYEILDEAGQNVVSRVFPVRGKGLWSTMLGYVGIRQSVENPNDLTIIGLKFYKQAETPGLGGEVDNDVWRKKWIGKKIYDLDEELSGEGYSGYVVGAQTSKTATNNPAFAVDAIAGATITSAGVTHTFQFWFGPLGFGKYLWNETGVRDTKALEQPKVETATNGPSTDANGKIPAASADPAKMKGDTSSSDPTKDEVFDGGTPATEPEPSPADTSAGDAK